MDREEIEKLFFIPEGITVWSSSIIGKSLSKEVEANRASISGEISSFIP